MQAISQWYIYMYKYYYLTRGETNMMILIKYLVYYFHTFPNRVATQLFTVHPCMATLK
jgi:hypothetical protein